MASESHLHYRRCGRVLRLDIRMSPLETREVLVGLFARLQDDDRAELLQTLLMVHTEPTAYLSQNASAVARAIGEETFNLATVSPMFHGELPRAELPRVG